MTPSLSASWCGRTGPTVLQVAPVELVEWLLRAPVGVGLLAVLEGRVRDDLGEVDMTHGSDTKAVEAAATLVAEVSWGSLLSVASETALCRVGPWMPAGAAFNLADAYRHVDDRRVIAEAIVERFGAALLAPMDATAQQWWWSAPSTDRRPRGPWFEDFSQVYGAGQFTFAGRWTVSDPPPEAHEDLIASWEIEPYPVSRWRLPVEGDVAVWEIHCPDDWVRLVTTYPAVGGVFEGWELPGANQHRRELEVLLAVEDQHAARVEGRQLVPDWKAVAGDLDGVHLSWAGFLTSEGYVSDLGAGDVTMLRYWMSERTLWLRDVFGDPIPLPAPRGRSGDVGIDVRDDAARRRADLDILDPPTERRP